MKEYKNKTEQELRGIITEKRKALQPFRFNLSGSKIKNVKEGKGLRKQIAQAMTEINSKKKMSA